MRSSYVGCEIFPLETPFVEITAPNGTLVATEAISNGQVIFEVKDPVWAQTYSVKTGDSETTFRLASPRKSFQSV